MVVGEGQILGQIKDALALGQELHTAGRLINDLFQQALRVGKRAHSETGIDRAGQSLVTFGLEQLAVVEPGEPVDAWAADKRVLVIGAGSMSSLAATTLARLGVRELVIANRTPERAERLAAALSEQSGVSAHAVPMASVDDELTRADVAVSCTGATGLVLTAEAVATALAQHVVPEAPETTPSPRKHLRAPEGSVVARLAAAAARDGRVAELPGGADDLAGLPGPPDAGVAGASTPGAGVTGADGATGSECPVGLDDSLAQHGAWVDNASRAPRTAARSAAVNGKGPVRLALLDLAMPRDIDAAVHRLDGVRLVDIESLAEASADAPMAADVDQVRSLVSDEVAAFGAAQRAAHITPTVVALRTMAADVVAGEMARLEGRLTGLDEKQRAEITQTVRRVVDKLLHAPTVRVKQLAGEPGGAGYADALRTLFDLDPETVASVSRADLNDADVKNRGRV